MYVVSVAGLRDHRQPATDQARVVGTGLDGAECGEVLEFQAMLTLQHRGDVTLHRLSGVPPGGHQAADRGLGGQCRWVGGRKFRRR